MSKEIKKKGEIMKLFNSNSLVVFFGLISFVTLGFLFSSDAQAIARNTDTGEIYDPRDYYNNYQQYQPDDEESTDLGSYALGDDTHTETITTNRAGSWTDWCDCEDVSGDNSAPRGLHMYELDSNGNFEKAQLSCRQLDSWSASGGYTLSDWFFNTDDDGAFEYTQVDSDKLPVGLDFGCESELGCSEFSFLQLSPADIMDGEIAARAASSVAGNPVDDWALYIDDKDVQLREPLQCDSGYVLTGMKLETDDANWPYNGKVITGMGIRCTELVDMFSSKENLVKDLMKDLMKGE